MMHKWDGFITLDVEGRYKAVLYCDKKIVISKVFMSEENAIAWLKAERDLREASEAYGTKKVEL